MINRIRSYPISLLLNPKTNVIFLIYEFQRRFTWSTWQWDEFFENLTRNDGGHYLGTIVCSNINVDSVKTKRLEVIDGLQRLTTLGIIFLALYSMMDDKKAEFDEDQMARFLQLKHLLKRTMSIIPQAKNRHLDSYNSLLMELKIIDTDPEAVFKRDSRVYRAFYFFIEKIQEMIDSSEAPAIETMFYITEQIASATVNIFEVSKNVDPDSYSINRRDFDIAE